MSALGAFTQDNMSKLNIELNAKDGEDSDHQLSIENESKKKKISKCNPCCCCRGEDSDDELRASAKAAFKAVQEERVAASSNTEERASQTESIEMVTHGTETAPNSPVSSAESSYSPAFKHFKTPSFWPKDNKDDDDDDSDGQEFANADFRPPTSKLDLVGNNKKELELLERKRSGKDLVDDEDSLVETLQLTKPDKVKISNDSSVENQEKSVSQDEVISSDPKVAACFGCQKFSSFTWPLKKI